MSLREQILDGIKTTLQGIPELKAVHRPRVAKAGGNIFGDTPWALVLRGTQSNAPAAASRTTHTLEVVVVIAESVSGGEPESSDAVVAALLDKARAVIVAADRMGLAHVFDVSVDSDEISEEQEQDGLVKGQLTLEVVYFSDASNPEVYTSDG